MRRLLIVCLLLAGGWGCAAGPRISTDLGTQPASAYGWNIGAADLLDPSTSACRLGMYLDELTVQGYAKQVRIIYTPDWGPQVLHDWIPVIRAKSFRVLVILSQDGRGQPYTNDSRLGQQAVWMLQGLPPITDILDAIQLANEPDGFSGKSPSDYTTWHRVMREMVRQIVPTVPVLSPDFRGAGAWNDWVSRTQLDYGRDYDVISLHVTHVDKERDLQTYVNDVQRWTGRYARAHLGGRTDGGTDLPDPPLPRVWITEGDWGQRVWFAGHGLPVERTYIYVYNGHEPESRRTGALPCQ